MGDASKLIKNRGGVIREVWLCLADSSQVISSWLCDLALKAPVNGDRKLISCRRVKFDHFRVHWVSAGSVWTQPRCQFFSRW